MLQREEADEMAVRPFALRPLPVYVALNVVVAVHMALNVVVDRDVGGLVLLGHGAHLLGAGFG